MICEKGLGVSNDYLPAKQSAIFAFSAETLKLLRTSARFLLSKGSEKPHSRASVADLCAILSVEN